MYKRLLIAGAIGFAVVSASAEPVSYTIDPTHTDVLAQWSHFGFSNPSAHFGQVEGTLIYDADDAAASSVEVTIPMASLNSFVPKLDEHMKGVRFFDVAKFPNATFKSTQVEALGGGRLKVTGDLTLKGVTHPVTLDAVLNGIGEHAMHKRQAIGFDATAEIQRSDFGITEFIPAVSDAVRLRITTEALAPAAR
ncbi:MAG: YceI family protein [Xanthomonadaceae bacterium]|jgi:polyisoprenoid-binding protein YceI|nr:YceI family protein [Xanthomonadaceae bacterium]